MSDSMIIRGSGPSSSSGSGGGGGSGTSELKQNGEELLLLLPLPPFASGSKFLFSPQEAKAVCPAF